MRFNNIAAVWMICAALALPAYGQEPAAEQAGPNLQFQTGTVVLPNKSATLDLGEKYRYLSPAETEKLLVTWGNPPGSDTEGAIIPTEVDPFSSGGWAVILTYEDEGHIDDSDAAELDYDDMLKDMKEETESSNAARKSAGIDSVHLIGWAEKPRYDSATRKMYWAKELNFEGTASHTLNYDVRVLGREGVLSMNAVASMDQLAQIRSDMQPLIRVAEFNEGFRYAEFNKKTDRMAEYGLAALIAGAAATKLGLLGKLGVMLLAFKKFIFIGLAAIGGLFAKFFKKKDSAS